MTERVRIDADAAKARIDSGEAAVLDVVHADTWELLPTQVKDAVRIDPEEIEQRFAELPRDKQIIAYCT